MAPPALPCFEAARSFTTRPMGNLGRHMLHDFVSLVSARNRPLNAVPGENWFHMAAKEVHDENRHAQGSADVGLRI